MTSGRRHKGLGIGRAVACVLFVLAVTVTLPACGVGVARLGERACKRVAARSAAQPSRLPVVYSTGGGTQLVLLGRSLFACPCSDRYFGSVGEQRLIGEAREGRKLGADSETRVYGEATERRKLGSTDEARMVGAAAEDRIYGAQRGAIMCFFRPRCNGFVVSGLAPSNERFRERGGSGWEHCLKWSD